MENHIRHWRRERGLSQEALGKRVGLGKAAISKLERGQMGLRDVTIAKLVDVLDVSAGDLLGDYASREAVARKAPPSGPQVAEDKSSPERPSKTPETKETKKTKKIEEASETEETGETDFGFQRVAMGDKAALVRDVFSSVAERYDLMNDLMSLGVHRLWKGALIDQLKPRAGERIIDVAGGTGDIAFRIHERRAGVHVTVCDINREMVEIGRDRAIDRGLVPGGGGGGGCIDWLCGDAEALPFPDASMDAYTIAFGIRNVTRIDAALTEARRVLKPGGRFLCLEFSHVAVPALAGLYDAYSLHVLPAIGALVAGDGDAYRYLSESIRRFPDQQRFAAMITASGLGQCRHRNLSGGIAALHSAWRI